jgi:hypothetical protein
VSEAPVALTDLGAEARELCAKIKEQDVPRGSAEIAYAYNVVNGRVLLLDEVRGRSYPELGDEWVAGTVDVVHQDRRGLWVGDWKLSGYGFDAELHRPQLEVYALMVARVQQVDRVRCWVGGVDRDRGTLAFHRWAIDPWDLERVALDLRQTRDRVVELRAQRAAHERESVGAWTPDVRMGGHCTWCPAFARCPGVRGVCWLFSADEPPTVTEQALADTFLGARVADAAQQLVRETVGRWIDAHGPAQTQDGRYVRRSASGALTVLKHP